MQTPRLVLRHLTPDDAPFVVELLNDPDWLRFIGDRKVRTLADAQRYLDNGPIAMYRSAGFGLYLVLLRAADTPIGVCGLIRREGLDDVDIGFAFLPAWRANGYAYEASVAVIDEGRSRFGLTRIVAIVSPDNARSIRLLDRLGFHFERRLQLPGDRDEVALYVRAT